ncbi:MAG: hypothetical protein HKN92_04740 [Chitinophagales bacterium]|nr:hypothetical protein [Chitinophagales bacterium]
MKNLIFIFSMLLLVTATFGQDLVVENVSPKMRKFKGVQEIENFGYYCFVQDEKSKKGFKLFNLDIWDHDLNEIGKGKIELEKKSIAIDAVYNGKNFLAVFYDSKKDNVRAISFDQKGEIVAEKLMDGIKTKFMMMEDMVPSYYAAGSEGFYGIVPDKQKKFGFTITRYDNNLKEIWSTEFFPPKGLQVVMDAKSTDDKLVVLKYAKASKMTKRTAVDLTAFDSKTGKEMWTYDLSTGDRTYLPSEMDVNEKGNVAVAGMYFDGDKVKGLKSDGIFFTHIDGSGGKIAATSQPWKGKLQDFLKGAKNSLTMGKPKVVFEEMVYDPASGDYKLVGELFTIGTAGKVMSMLGGNSDAETKVTIEDIVVFTFSADADLTDFYSVDKARSHIYVPASYAGGLKIAMYLKSTGSLPFKFVGKDEEGNAMAYYIDFLKQGEDGSLTSAKLAGFNAGKMGVGMLNLNQSTAGNAMVKYLPLTKKAANKDEGSDIEFDSKRSIIAATKSKPGFILISELTKKTGDLRLFLEEVN